MVFRTSEDKDASLVKLKEASVWATQYNNRPVSISNISYLLQYGKVKKYSFNGSTCVDINELKSYYDQIKNECDWKKALGEDLNWKLSFSEYSESERTKHVHRIHPYKGKFIPQLVEYFLDSRVDDYKKTIYFTKGDIILDPFAGSGTTLVQANELGIHAVGADISAFNAMISNVKIERHDVARLNRIINQITVKLIEFNKNNINAAFEKRLQCELDKFNEKYFPSPDYRRKINLKEIEEGEYSTRCENEFLPIYYSLVEEYKLEIYKKENDSFLATWYLLPVRNEIDFVFNEIKNVEDKNLKKVLAVILSRTARSCRATTHADLGTLKEPVTRTYYCKKHGKICKPLFSILDWWIRYSNDSIKRIIEFDKLRTDTFQICLAADSSTVDLIAEVEQKNAKLAELIKEKKIKGIFSSPPYVGVIDYHEQHAYAYEIFGFERKDEQEIGRLLNGQTKAAKEAYAAGISSVLNNCKKYLQDNYDVFLVANDKFNLYPLIAEKSGMKIVERFKRPVLNRVEKDRSTAYAEIIFHLKEK